MRFGIKGASIAALTTAVLTTTACGTSGKKVSSAPSTSATSTSVATTAATGSSSSTPSAPSATPPVASTGASASTLTKDQISKLLLTDKDDPGYTYDPSQDDTSTLDTQEVVTTGGSVCQTFMDAQDALSTKYGTTAQVSRELSKAAEGHAIEDSVIVLPSADKALALISDLTAGIKGCKTLTTTQSGGQVAMAPSAIPQLMRDGQAGYIMYMTGGGKSVLMAAELTHVGTAVSVVALIGPVTYDKTELERMGATLAHLSSIQFERLKTAQGLS